jgi:phage shock protein A
MALSIFSKIAIIAKSGTHSLLDKLIDMNDVGAVEQLIRDLEAAIQTESTEAIRADVNAKSLHTQATAIQAKIDQFNKAIERILGDDDPSNDGDAEPMAAKVISLEEEVEEIKASETSATENHNLLADTLSKLQERHLAMIKQLRQLRSAKTQAAADNQAVKAVRQAKAITEGVDSTHLGDALHKAQENSAVAREELKQAVGGIQSSPEALLAKSAAAQRIAEMRAKLGK